MAELKIDQIEHYLRSIVGSSARVLSLEVLGEPRGDGIKGYGYGKPVLIHYEIEGEGRRAALHTVSPGPFGHEHMSDRAQILLWEHSSLTAFHTISIRSMLVPLGVMEARSRWAAQKSFSF